MSEADLDASSMSAHAVDRPHEPLHALRHVRESAGLHIAALAAALKVPVRKLEALEAGRYEELPDLTFARALASSACRQLKVDPRPILEQIPVGRLPALGPPGGAINAPFKASMPGGGTSQSAWFLRPAVLIAALLGAAALVLLVLPEVVQLPVFGAGSSRSATEPGQRTEDLQLEPAFPPGTSDNGSEAADDGGTVSESVLPASDEAPASPAVPESGDGNANAAAPGAAQPAASIALLNITATDETWVEVVNGAGAVVTQRVLKAGDVIEYSSSPPYKVILGRAEAARVSVRGRSLDVMPYARNSVARFEVK